MKTLLFFSFAFFATLPSLTAQKAVKKQKTPGTDFISPALRTFSVYGFFNEKNLNQYQCKLAETDDLNDFLFDLIDMDTISLPSTFLSFYDVPGAQHSDLSLDYGDETEIRSKTLKTEPCDLSTKQGIQGALKALAYLSVCIQKGKPFKNEVLKCQKATESSMVQEMYHFGWFTLTSGVTVQLKLSSYVDDNGIYWWKIYVERSAEELLIAHTHFLGKQQ